jgi:YbgC/YbaW family acyl-CoA thioester hydrolase
MFIHKTKVRMFHTDSARILFFGSFYLLVQEAFEEFLISRGLNIATFINHPTHLLPVVHSEADYKKPLRLGDPISIGVEVGRVGETSITLDFTVWNRRREIAGKGKVVSVNISRKTWKKTALPRKLRKILVTAARK